MNQKQQYQDMNRRVHEINFHAVQGFALVDSLVDSLVTELTKITTMLLKASRYITFLVFFQVSSITILVIKSLFIH